MTPAASWHLFFNMFGLWVFGGDGRRRYLGRKRYAGVLPRLRHLRCRSPTWLLSVLEGVLKHTDFRVDFEQSRRRTLIGASAGVFGVIMACGATSRPTRSCNCCFRRFRLKLKWFAYGYVGIAAISLLSSAKNAGGDAAHLGGALAGFFFIRNAHLLRDFFDVFSDSRKPKRSRSPREPGWGKRAPSQAEVDRILAKVGMEGINSLTEEEKRILHDATEAERRPR